MKRFVIELSILVSILLLVGCGNHHDRYTQTAVVVEVDAVTNEVICEDINGNLWTFTESGWIKGDAVNMVMDGHNTVEVEDDIIIRTIHS